MMNTKFKIIISCAVLMFSSVSIAIEKYKNNLNTCSPSKNIIDNYEPLKFNLTNNLITNSNIDKSNNLKPQIIILGKLLDKHCLPIPNANIYAWQVSPQGKYNYEPLRKFAVNKSLLADKDDSFIGNASTITDNEGNFALITLMPKKGKIPTSQGINVRAEHHKLGKIQIRFAFHPNSKELMHVQYLNDDNSAIYNLKLVMDKAVSFKEH